MDLSIYIAIFSAIATAFGGGFGLGYRVGHVSANPFEKTKCHKKEGSRAASVTVRVFKRFFSKSFNCRHKKGNICLLDNTKCDFKP
jgi:hypothetical protein